MRKLVRPRPALEERRWAWTALFDGVTHAPNRVPPIALLEVAIRSLQKHSGPLKEPSGPWLDHYAPSVRAMALWTALAAFGMPHEYADLNDGEKFVSVEDPTLSDALDLDALDQFAYYLWRGHIASPLFWATRISDGTVLTMLSRLRELVQMRGCERTT